MISNVNNYYATIKNIEIEQIPEISNPVLEVFTKHADCDFKPIKTNLYLNSRVKLLNHLNDKLINFKNCSTLSKVLSVCYLILTTSTFVLGMTLVDPLFFMATIAFPIISMFICYEIFTRESRVQKSFDENLAILNDKIEMFKKIMENHPVIRQGILEELSQIDLTKANVDVKRTQQLVAALEQLDKSVILIEKLKK